VIVDASGNPLVLSLTGGQVHDITPAEALAAQVKHAALIANRGYDADYFVETLNMRVTPVIPPKSNSMTRRD
jgi:hypothetical protein